MPININITSWTFSAWETFSETPSWKCIVWKLTSTQSIGNLKIFSRRIQGERAFFYFFQGVSRIFKEIDIFPGDSRISRSCGHPGCCNNKNSVRLGKILWTITPTDLPLSVICHKRANVWHLHTQGHVACLWVLGSDISRSCSSSKDWPFNDPLDL